jgi:hypothetical protein
MPPRGIANRNPGNLDRTSPRAGWRGALPDEALTDSRFEQFEDVLYGLRAMARVLVNYQTRHGLKTIRAIISRWAPPNENVTNSYIGAIATACMVEADEPYDLSDDDSLVRIMVAMIRFENGSQPYSLTTIREGIALARMEKET